MGQITVRTSDELLNRVRLTAHRLGRSMNDYVTAVLQAATNPDLAGDEAERTRERLASAGLLAPAGSPRPRPDADRVAAARAAAGRGVPLSSIVESDRE